MDAPWNCDVEYTPELVAAILSREIDLEIDEVRFFNEGFDNSAFLVNNQFVFRFVRREEGRSFFEHELKALPLLAGKLPLQIPSFSYSGLHDGKWPWAGYGFLEGSAIYESPKSDTREECLTPIASFLSALHRLPLQPFHAAAIPEDWFGHMDLEKRIPFCWGKLENLITKEVIEDSPIYARIIKEVSNLDTTASKALVHGDFKATHILVKNGAPSSVIDWGDVHIGHPATDLAIAYTFFSPRCRQKFWDAYGGCGPETQKLARFRALFHTLAIIEYTHATQRQGMLEDALNSLSWILVDETC